jgi:hypothetical protein
MEHANTNETKYEKDHGCAGRSISAPESRWSERTYLWPASTPENLLDVQHAQIGKTTLLGNVQLRSLDNNRMRRQIDTPRQRGRAAEHLDVPLCEQALHHRAIAPQHTCVMNANSAGEYLEHLFIPGFLGIFSRQIVFVEVRTVKGGGVAALLSLHGQHPGRLARILPRMDKHHGLVTTLQRIEDLLVANLVHDALPREEALLRDADKRRLERHRPVCGIKVEQACLGVDAKELRHVLIVWKRSRESD